MATITQLTDRQRQALLGGKTVQWAADAFGIPRPRLVAMVVAADLEIDAATDRVRIHRPVPAGIHTAPKAEPAPMSSNTPTVLEALRSGTPIVEVADAHGWTEQSLRALVNGHKGWTIGADGIVLIGDSGGPQPAPTSQAVSRRPDEPTGETPAAPTPTPVEMVAGGLEQLLADARSSGDKRIERAAAKVDAAVENLRGLYAPWLAEKEEAAERAAELAKAEDRAARLRAQLAAAQADIDALKGKPARKPSAKPKPNGTRGRSQAIREWAAERGIKVNERGRIPVHVVEQYDAAHQEAPDGT